MGGERDAYRGEGVECVLHVVSVFLLHLRVTARREYVSLSIACVFAIDVQWRSEHGCGCTVVDGDCLRAAIIRFCLM